MVVTNPPYISPSSPKLNTGWLSLALLLITSLSLNSHSAILPEDRADLLYHAYSGGGVTIDGPSLLVRKGYKDKVSVYANYYVDMVSSASIDVLSSGSKYTEQRNEYSLGAEYLIDRTIISLGYGNSEENDYSAETVSLGISQDFFGDMTTISMGFSQGDDTVRRNINGEPDPTFEEEAKRRRFSLNVTQVLTKNWIVAVNSESVIDDGYLNNPYRQVRFLNSAGDVNYVSERYPETRNSDAVALRMMYYLPYRASLRLEGRYFSDSWGIEASNYEIRYTHPIKDEWTFEVKYRGYSQSQADFYSDLFTFDESADDFLARDKEMSEFGSQNFGLGFTYEAKKEWHFVKKESVSLMWDYIQFDYANFRNRLLSLENNGTPGEFEQGEEPFYNFDANVIRLFVSIYY